MAPTGPAAPTPSTLAPAAEGPRRAAARRLREGLCERLAAWSVPALRVALGLVFLVFGVLKFFPGASPAEQIVRRTVEALTFGLVDGTAAVVLTAVVETAVGLALLTGRALRAGLVVLAVTLAGVLSPVALFPGDLFGDGMTLMGQYVLKDVVLVAAAGVVAAATLGARFTLAAAEPARAPAA